MTILNFLAKYFNKLMDKAGMPALVTLIPLAVLAIGYVLSVLYLTNLIFDQTSAIFLK